MRFALDEREKKVDLFPREGIFPFIVFGNINFKKPPKKVD